MATNKSLAITSFMSEPDDSLATADVYDIKTDDVINNLPTIDSSVEAERTAALEEGMRGGASMVEGLPLKKDSALAGIHEVTDKVGQQKSLLSLSNIKMVASESLKSAAGVMNLAGMGNFTGPSLLSQISKGGLSSLPGVSKNSLSALTANVANGQVPGSLKSALSLPTGNSLGTYINTGTQSLRIAQGDKTAANQLLGTLAALSPDNNPNRPHMEDRDGAVRLITGLANTGLQLGVPNLFGQATSLAGGNKAVLTQAASLVLKSAAGYGSVGGMRDVTKSYNSLYGSSSTLYASNPSILNDVSSNYQKPLQMGQTRINGPAVSSEFTDTMDTFNDLNPSWNSTPRRTDSGQVETSLNLSAISNGNRDFQSMIMQGVRNSPDSGDSNSVKFMALATQFPTESSESILARNFPRTVTSIDTLSANSIKPVQADDMVPVIQVGSQYGDWRDNINVDGRSGNVDRTAIVKTANGRDNVEKPLPRGFLTPAQYAEQTKTLGGKIGIVWNGPSS